MLADIGPLATARKLVKAPVVSGGFAALWERGRLDLTVEALALDPRVRGSFTDQTRSRSGSLLNVPEAEDEASAAT
jgi:hypothetical protein